MLVAARGSAELERALVGQLKLLATELVREQDSEAEKVRYICPSQPDSFGVRFVCSKAPALAVHVLWCSVEGSDVASTEVSCALGNVPLL